MIRDPIDIKNSNIWQKAGKASQNILNANKHTVIVLGDQKAGKTSFVKIIKGDIQLQSKPTRLIDYFTMKKQGNQVQFYEISSPKFLSILQFLIKPQTAPYVTIVMCVDLTQTQNFVFKINQKIQKLRKDLKNIVQIKQLDKINKYSQQRAIKYKFIQTNDDIQSIKRMPFGFVIAGCKYDLFEKNLKAEQKKWICRCLRYLSHINQGTLMFSTIKNMQFCAQIRQLFGQQILNIRTKTYSNQKDHNKPLYILAGQDRISQMNLPSFNNSGAFNQMKILQQQLQSVFPSKKHIQLKQESQNKTDSKKFASIGLDSIISKYKKEVNVMLANRNNGKTKKKIQQDESGNEFSNTKSKFANTQDLNKINASKKMNAKKNPQQQQYVNQNSFLNKKLTNSQQQLPLNSQNKLRKNDNVSPSQQYQAKSQQQQQQQLQKQKKQKQDRQKSSQKIRKQQKTKQKQQQYMDEGEQEQYDEDEDDENAFNL